MNMTTVEDKKKKCANQEVKLVETELQLMERFGHPGYNTMLKILNDNVVKDCPVTGRDLMRAYDIFGTPVAQIKGKAVTHKANNAAADQIFGLTCEQQTCNVDLMHVEGIPFLVNVLTPMGFTHVDKLQSRHGEEISRALRRQLTI